MLVLAVAVLGIAIAQIRVHRTSVSAASVQAKQVRDWLSQHSQSPVDAELGPAADLGKVSVVVRRATSDTPPSVTPLPASGAEGDVVEVTFARLGAGRTWPYVWGGHGWRLQDYRAYHISVR
ncbi:hypothetical protein CKY51_01080 [Xanthomonas maliensis]|nr:hypothetical protein CKY51_01080 [Xanthomonas maliensis]